MPFDATAPMTTVFAERGLQALVEMSPQGRQSTVRIREGIGVSIRTRALTSDSCFSSSAGIPDGFRGIGELPLLLAELRANTVLTTVLPQALALTSAAAEEDPRFFNPSDSVSLRVGARASRVLTAAGEVSSGEVNICQVVWRTRIKGARYEATWAGTADCDLGEVLTQLQASLGEEERIRRGAQSPPPGPAIMVLTPSASAAFIHEVVGHALEGDNALGGSALWRQRSDAHFPPSLTVVEDPTGPGCWVPAAVDDEGALARTTYLVEAGQVACVLTDLDTAIGLGQMSTGSGRRENYRGRGVPRMRHTTLHPGVGSSIDLAGLTSDCIMVDTIESGHVDTRSGRFSLRVRCARHVRRGVPEEPFGCFTLSGDLGSLGGIRAIGDDLKRSRFFCGKGGVWLPTSAETPSLLIDGLEVCS